MRLNGATEGQYDVVRTPAVPYTTPNIAVHADPRVVPEIFHITDLPNQITNNLGTESPA